MRLPLSLIDGHKTKLGVLGLFLLGGAKAVGWIDEQTFQALVVIIGAWTAYGLRDAIKKLE